MEIPDGIWEKANECIERFVFAHVENVFEFGFCIQEGDGNCLVELDPLNYGEEMLERVVEFSDLYDDIMRLERIDRNYYEAITFRDELRQFVEACLTELVDAELGEEAADQLHDEIARIAYEYIDEGHYLEAEDLFDRERAELMQKVYPAKHDWSKLGF